MTGNAWPRNLRLAVGHDTGDRDSSEPGPVSKTEIRDEVLHRNRRVTEDEMDRMHHLIGPAVWRWTLLAAMIVWSGTIAASADDHEGEVGAASAATKSIGQPAVVEEAPGQSGVYGFSGAKAGDNAPEGVIGECIWIFDQANKSQVAKGECRESDPGQFRITLTPGKYVVHGPGGNRAIEVKQGQWVKIVSIVPVPASF